MSIEDDGLKETKAYEKIIKLFPHVTEGDGNNGTINDADAMSAYVVKYDGKKYRVNSKTEMESLYNAIVANDPLNPNKELRERPRLGMVIMKDFAYQKDNIWDEGTLYDPKKGKTYSGKITLKDKNTLDLRGYIGVPALGRSSTWTRADDGSAE